jgi:hypothetical protein
MARTLNSFTVTLQGLKLSHKGSVNKRFTQSNQGIDQNLMKMNKISLLANIENYHLLFERVDFN